MSGRRDGSWVQTSAVKSDDWSSIPGQKFTSNVFLNSALPCFQTWFLADWLSRPVSELQVLLSLPPQRWPYRASCSVLLLCGCWRPKRKSSCCMLLAEPSPQPWHLYFSEGLGMADFLETPALECPCSWAVDGFCHGH